MRFTKIKLPFKLKKSVLALGAQGKNTTCFAKGQSAYISRLHPDLNSPKDFLQFSQTVKYFLKKQPQAVVCDLHPEYQSSKYMSCSQYIQHHHAHIASGMAENGLKNRKVIGIAFDGTGLGTDDKLWGAEFLICDYKNFIRVAHLKEIPLLGGERAILEPWRVAAAWMYLIYKEKFLSLKISFIKNLDKNKWRILKKMYKAGFNSPLTSSMGRLFDAVAVLVLEKNNADYEAELALGLERLAIGYKLPATSYNFKLLKEGDSYILDPAPMFKQVVSDLKNNEPKGKIAYKFHLTVAEMARKTCAALKNKSKINEVVLSGGVFQNKLLLRLSSDLLYKEGFQVFTHQSLPCNDSTISLGQAVIAGCAAKRLNSGRRPAPTRK